MKPYPKEWSTVSCYDWCEDEENIWLCLAQKNAICEINKKTRDVSIIGHFPNKELMSDKMSLSATKVGNYVVFPPFGADKIAIFDTFSKKLDFLDYPVIKDKYASRFREDAKFYRTIAIDNDLFFLGLSYPGILRMNVETKEMFCFDDWVDEIDGNKCSEALRITDGYATFGEDFILPLGNCSGFLKVNFHSLEWEYIKLPFEIFGILGMVQCGDWIWMTENLIVSKRIIAWNYLTGQYKEVELPDSDLFNAPLLCRNQLFLWGKCNRKNYRLDTTTLDVEEMPNEFISHKTILFTKPYLNGFHFFSDLKGGLFYYDLINNHIDQTPYYLTDESFLLSTWESYSKDFIDETKHIIVRETDVSLECFVKSIISG